MSKDFASLSPSELNSFLADEHGFGLFPLTSIVHSIVLEPISSGRPGRPLGEGWDYPGCHSGESRFLTAEEAASLLKRVQPASPETEAMNRAGLYELEDHRADRDVVRGLQKKIVNLRDKIEETIREIDELGYGNRVAGRAAELERLANWGAGELLCALQGEYRRLDDLLATVGRPPSARTEAACLWAQHLRRRGRRVPWVLISDLVDWFAAKLSPYEFYKGLLGSDELCDPENLRHKFFKHVERWELIYAHRCREPRPLPLGAGISGARSCVLTFDPTGRECGAIIRIGSREFHPLKFPADVVEAARRVLWSPGGSGNGAVFPDLTYFSEELPPKPC